MIGNSHITFHPTLRVMEGVGTWHEQRDTTQLRNDFERQARSVSKRLFHVTRPIRYFKRWFDGKRKS